MASGGACSSGPDRIDYSYVMLSGPVGPVAGLDAGSQVALALLKCGDSDVAVDPDVDPPDPLYYMLLETTVGPIGVVCNVNGDVLRYKLPLKGGDISGPKTLSELGLTVTPP